MQTNISGRVITILAVMYMAFSVLFPALPPGIFWLMHPFQEISAKPALKPGLDMVGGSSLLYEIIPAEGTPPNANLADTVRMLLRERVDPQGVKNLIWRAQGGNRLEIQMPMTEESKQVKELRADYAKATDALNSFSIRWAQVESALAIADPAERQARLDELAHGSTKRLALFADLVREQDKIKAAAAARDAEAEAQAQLALTALIPEVGQLSIDAQRVEGELNKTGQARLDAIQELKQIDPTFTAQNEAIDKVVATFDEWDKVRESVGDVAQLKQLLRGSGVLSFHIVAQTADQSQVQEMRQKLEREGPRYRTGEPLRWIPLDRPDEARGVEGRLLDTHNGVLYVLVWMTPQASMVNREGLPKWALESAKPETDPQTGKPIVSFRFDAVGGIRFAELTGRNKGELLAAVLDDKVISLATINSTIGQNGMISGDFSGEKILYLVKTLRAGSLPAKLSDEPINERSIGPQLGADNLRAGLIACFFGVGVVAFFLIGYYYLSGVVAMIAVLLNIVLILAGMSMFNATFTLPGVAGIILTIGMAVDANVLIFERLREEQMRGLSLRVAMRMAYDRASSAILDSNVTAAITGAILWLIGTEDVKGFGLTLLLGIVASLFTALFVTRTIFIFLVEKVKIKKLGSIPMSLPWWNKLLNPNINWMGKMFVLLSVSSVLILSGLVIFATQIKSSELWDIEFAGGTSVQFDLKEPMTIGDVRELVDQEVERDPNGLPAPQVQSVGEPIGDSKDPLYKSYEIITVNTNASQVKEAISKTFTGKLNVAEAARFDGYDSIGRDSFGKIAFPIENERTQIPGVNEKIPAMADHLGGFAILMRNFTPHLSETEIKERIEQERIVSGGAASRRVEVVWLSNQRDVVILVSDPHSIYDPANELDWITQFGRPTLTKIVDSLTHPAEFGRVSQSSASVSNDTSMNAIMALLGSLLMIVVYIWLRFNEFRYSFAAVIALVHDVLILMTAIAFSHLLAGTIVGDALLLEPFRMNLTLVTAILTVIGFSMSDTVVVFDRIRENRAKIGHVDRSVINMSINQTLSRTLLTGGTTLVTLFVMYITGGPAIHGFTFALVVGLTTGTYSSIAIASPLLLLGGKQVEPVRPKAEIVTVAADGTLT